MNQLIVGLSLAATGILLLPRNVQAQKLNTSTYEFVSLNKSLYGLLSISGEAAIFQNVLSLTNDAADGSGRSMINKAFMMWEKDTNDGHGRVASFNTSFLMSILSCNGSVSGQGLAFVISPDVDVPLNSSGEYLGLTNSTTDGDASNGILAIEFDTLKQDFDPDNNHIGLDIHSVRSNKTRSLSQLGIQLARETKRFYMVWIHYNGVKKSLEVYMAEQEEINSVVSRPANPLLTAHDLDLKSIIHQYSYFGFAASKSNGTQSQNVIKWSLAVELLPGSGDPIKIYVKIIVTGLVLLFIGIAILIYYLHRKKATSSNNNLIGALKNLPGMPREFQFRDLKTATNNFDEKNKLGKGGFGVVYKGLLSKENLHVAVKMFSRDNTKGQEDFLSELSIINRLRHKHLVRLLGWCHKKGRLLLVYEYMPNGSLDKHLFPEEGEKTIMEWKLRYNILVGVASALNYLHNEYNQKVVHRDLKASNIMLDSNFNSQLGDFGLARALETEKTSYAELEGVAGTMGYIAPECFLTNKATRHSDIYGFGAVILEVVCGKRPWTKIAGFQLLVDWVWWLHREGRILDAVDERLGNNYAAEEAEALLLLGLACSHPIASERPKAESICQIMARSMPVPRVPPFKPAFVWPSDLEPDSNRNNSSNTAIISDSTPKHFVQCPDESVHTLDIV